MHRTETCGAWLDAALTEHLGIVPAPGELWDRVRMPQAVMARPSVPARRWSMAMASALGALMAVGLWSFQGSGSREFRSQEFHSNDALATRAWVKGRTGLDVPLVAGGSPLIQLASVRFWNGARSANGPATAELTFLVENRRATLRVSPAGATLRGNLQHDVLARKPGESKAASWVVRGRLYTLACASPEDLRIACSLCHGAGAL